MIRRVFLAFLVFGLVVCGDDGQGPEPIACTDDTGSVEVTVTTGASVRFDWEPACAVALLIVEQEASGRWRIGTAIIDEPLLAELRENLITPPVTYGVTPSGVDEIQPPRDARRRSNLRTHPLARFSRKQHRRLPSQRMLACGARVRAVTATPIVRRWPSSFRRARATFGSFALN